ncbi:hypothetical protein PF003_g29002 [Phytophthora fragariae]|nr:hypothetical protein PF003_g29002 [Phytophthora fragariae]
MGKPLAARDSRRGPIRGPAQPWLLAANRMSLPPSTSAAPEILSTRPIAMLEARVEARESGPRTCAQSSARFNGGVS